MKHHPEKSHDAAELRRHAEERLKQKQLGAGAENSRQRSEADLRRVQHELEVHQVELEMQNEALLDAQATIELALARVTDLFDFAPTGYFNFAPDGTVMAVNLAGARLVGAGRAEIVKRPFKTLVLPEDQATYSDFHDCTLRGAGRERCELRLLRFGSDPVHVEIEAVASADGREIRASIWDVSERHEAEVERGKLITELQHALEQVKLLSGLLPICASCKKIRDDKGYWERIEVYISGHSEATFTHGLCPECMPRYFNDYEDEALVSP